ncbi:putative nucleoredoxin 1-1 [Silene latifolia]|uniref:putative nucleoredoxin 1-1 n=1 Tax=Silene latifolia TaxID=37657 RepID=UPI003D77EE09
MFFPDATWSFVESEADQIRKTYGYGCDDSEAMNVDSDKEGINLVSNLTKRKTTKITKGKKIKGRFRRFLSNHGKTTHLVRFKQGYGEIDEHVGFDFLRGKYLLICCFTVPILSYDDSAEKCRAIIEAYNELSQKNPPFEMIVVAKMRTDVVYNQKAAFDHFYSAFSCLAIPFSDFETRGYICSSISGSNLGLDDGNSAILVDPNGIVLHKDEALEYFFYHGSDWAPFLGSTLHDIYTQDEVLRSRLDPMHPFNKDRVNDDQLKTPLSLYGDILCCDPSLVLRRFHAETDVACSVLDLSRKYVGLYLCINRSIMEEIKKAHDNCLAKNQELEIVLVCMSFSEETNLYYTELCNAMRFLNIKSWFLFDYNSKSCRRLWRIFGQGYWYPEEKLIIIPPNCESGELHGIEIIKKFGINEYPFTRTSILKRRLEYLRSLPPVFSSLVFKNGLTQNGLGFNEEQLQGKNVLLYLDFGSGADKLYRLLIQNYENIKAMGSEVVFVPLRGVEKHVVEHCWNRQMVERVVIEYRTGFNFEEMPWPYMPPWIAAKSKSDFKKTLFFPEDDRIGSYLFAVGKDGKIVSRNVEDRLNTDGVTESLFDDVLESDLAFRFAHMPISRDDDYY